VRDFPRRGPGSSSTAGKTRPQDRAGQGRRPAPASWSWRAAGHSIDEIARRGWRPRATALNRNRDRPRVIAEQGLPRLVGRRPDAERGGPARGDPGPRRGGRLRCAAGARRGTRLAGLLLAIPDLIDPRRPGPGGRGGLPVRRQDPGPVLRAVAAGAQADQHAGGVSHVYDIAADPRRPRCSPG